MKTLEHIRKKLSEWIYPDAFHTKLSRDMYLQATKNMQQKQVEFEIYYPRMKFAEQRVEELEKRLDELYDTSEETSRLAQENFQLLGNIGSLKRGSKVIQRTMENLKAQLNDLDTKLKAL